MLFAAQRVVEDRNVVVLDDNNAAGSPDDESSFAASEGDGSATNQPLQPVETFPPAEPAARNFLITGADNNACIDPDSPYAGAFGDRESFGARSDTIMLWRVNPATSQVAVLSFPRDLWVTIAGRSSEQRINVAYERDNPQRLIDTIYQNFLIEVDHYIQVDFCAFKILVDAVGGVSVPFDFPVRDPNTGLNVPEAGCFNFNGDHALAYVRSRKLQYLTESGEWKQDGTSDLGRISRQQDFIRRTVDSLLAAGAFNPSVIRALIRTSDDYVVVDNNLSINKQLEFAGVLREVDPADITTYQIEARGATIQGQSVLIPQTGGSNMQAVFAVFRGDATLASAPEQVFETTTTAAPDERVTDYQRSCHNTRFTRRSRRSDDDGRGSSVRDAANCRSRSEQYGHLPRPQRQLLLSPTRTARQQRHRCRRPKLNIRCRGPAPRQQRRLMDPSPW